MSAITLESAASSAMASPASPRAATEPVRAVVYIRVSQARDGTISPELQLRAIEDYCRRRGYRLSETLQDLGLSGRMWQNRQMERSIGLVETDAADVIVVWRWSQVSRNRLDWAMALDRVDVAGRPAGSTTEGFDTSTSTGRLARGIPGRPVPGASTAAPPSPSWPAG